MASWPLVCKEKNSVWHPRLHWKPMMLLECGGNVLLQLCAKKMCDMCEVGWRERVIRTHTSLTNARPRSVMIFLTIPKVYNFDTSASATSVLEPNFKGSAMTHFVNKSVTVRTYLLSLLVFFSGPMRSIPTTSHGSFTCGNRWQYHYNTL